MSDDIEQPTEELVDDDQEEQVEETVEAEVKEEQAEDGEIEYLGFADEAPKAEETGSTDPFRGQEAPPWVKQYREENRELKRKLKELEAARGVQVAEKKIPELGEKPTLESADYDEDVYQQRMAEYYERKAQIDAAKAEAEAENAKVIAQWKAREAKYEQGKIALARDDYKDAEEAVNETLTQVQIGLLLEGVKEPAKLVYALGKSPAKLAALKGLSPVETAFALARLESQVTMNRKPKVQAEPSVQGASRVPVGGTNAKLEQLEAEADRTGDRSKIIAYKQQLKRQQRDA